MYQSSYPNNHKRYLTSTTTEIESCGIKSDLRKSSDDTLATPAEISYGLQMPHSQLPMTLVRNTDLATNSEVVSSPTNENKNK